MVQSASSKLLNGAGTVGRAALGAVAGGAAIGLAGRAIVKRTRKPKLLGVPLPRGTRKLKMKNVGKQISNFAEQLEQTGDDMRKASAHAKNVGKVLS